MAPSKSFFDERCASRGQARRAPYHALDECLLGGHGERSAAAAQGCRCRHPPSHRTGEATGSQPASEALTTQVSSKKARGRHLPAAAPIQQESRGPKPAAAIDTRHGGCCARVPLAAPIIPLLAMISQHHRCLLLPFACRLFSLADPSPSPSLSCGGGGRCLLLSPLALDAPQVEDGGHRHAQQGHHRSRDVGQGTCTVHREKGEAGEGDRT